MNIKYGDKMIRDENLHKLVSIKNKACRQLIQNYEEEEFEIDYSDDENYTELHISIGGIGQRNHISFYISTNHISYLHERIICHDDEEAQQMLDLAERVFADYGFRVEHNYHDFGIKINDLLSCDVKYYGKLRKNSRIYSSGLR